MDKKEKKKFKRRFIFAIVLILIADIGCLTYLTKKGVFDRVIEEETVVAMSLIERGEAAIDFMNQNIADENYRKILSSSQEVDNLIAEISKKDYSQLTSVYEITNLSDLLDFSMYSANIDDKKITPEQREYLLKKLSLNINNYISGSISGTVALATSAVTSYGYTFVDENLDSPIVYIYVYENAYPVLVAFSPGEDGSATVNTSYIIVDDLIGATEEDFNNSLNYGLVKFTVEKVK